jgi:phospholipid/cholesterol/gamma-HCH transport system substrate-binding protein
MLTRFVRIQLVIFTIASIVGILAMIFFYMQVPTLLGIGRMTVTMEMPAAGGLYRFGNVTYRGVEVGKVTSVELTRDGAKATLSLVSSAKIPSDLRAEVRSVSAVGEQYVDLRPKTDKGPYLHDGSVIPLSATAIPQDVAPMLDQVSALVGSIPKDKLSALLDESFKGFNGAGIDLGSLADSGAKISGDLNPVGDNTAALYNDAGPLLDSQLRTADSIKQWSRSLAGVSQQLVTNDPQIRTVLENGPGAFDEVSALLDQVKPTLPVLLANLTTIGQIGITYHASIEQLLVLLPPAVASTQAYGSRGNSTGLPLGDFEAGISDPPACSVGFLPPSLWRNPADTTTVDTPDGLYCKLPQDSPISVRGARNTPCMNAPGKRAPTVELCESDQQFTPLAMREHYVGPYPFDPNLVSQGVPLDDRVTFGDNIFAPTQGTPFPPGVGAPPGAAPPAPPPSANVQVPQSNTVPPSSTEVPHLPGQAPDGAVGQPSDGAAVPQAAPASSATAGPSVATAQYDPRTGRYVGPDGQLYQQADLATSSAPKTFEDMLPK